MKIWLIYDEQRYRHNKYYAEFYEKHFLKYGVKFNLILIEKLMVSGGKWSYNGQIVELPQCAIMRTYSLGLSKKLEDYGVRVFNNSTVSEIGNNKFKTYQFAAQNNLPVLETKLMTSFDENISFLYPFVVKSLDGHGGNEVYLVNDINEYNLAYEKLLHKPYIVQSVAKEIGKDLRVYVIGDKIITSMMRSSNGDFRSNYSLGGSAKQVEISLDIKNIVNKIISILPCDFIGIDFVFSKGKAYLNEIEDIVGARMLYAIGIDIVAQYVDYIVKDNLLK